ncbi:putative ribonuclease H-like domain-containing protein [Tanacetum coccineum]
MGLLIMMMGFVNWLLRDHTEAEETNHALMAISLKAMRRIGMKAVKEKEQLQKTLDSWKDSSKNLWRLIDSGMSSNSKVGLGFEIQSNNEVPNRFTKTNDYKGVPHPLSGDYTPKPQEEIDDSFEGSCGNTSEHSFETESESLSVQNEMSMSRSVRLEVHQLYSFDMKTPNSAKGVPVRLIDVSLLLLRIHSITQQVKILILPHGMKVIVTIKWSTEQKSDMRSGCEGIKKDWWSKLCYGLHQAPRAWYATLSTFLEKHGYKRGTIDKTLFIKRDKKDIMLVQVYVDDIHRESGSTKVKNMMLWLNLNHHHPHFQYITQSPPSTIPPPNPRILPSPNTYPAPYTTLHLYLKLKPNQFEHHLLRKPFLFQLNITRIVRPGTDLKSTKLTMGNALVKLVKKVKKWKGFEKEKYWFYQTSIEEEPEAKGRKIQDDPLDSWYKD